MISQSQKFKNRFLEKQLTIKWVTQVIYFKAGVYIESWVGLGRHENGFSLELSQSSSYSFNMLILFKNKTFLIY